MALYIRSEQVDRLARELAEATGEGLTEAVGTAIRERLGRVKPPEPGPSELERRDAAEQILRRARASCLAYGTTMPTKQEIEEMLGLDGY